MSSTRRGGERTALSIRWPVFSAGSFCSATTDPLYLEAIRAVLSGHLVRSFTDSSVRRMRGRLSAQVLRQAMEMIEDRLDTGFSIEELAKHCGMGVHHFTRLFKASTGRNPYRFVMDLRISRARDLLANTTLSLIEISYKLGFASQSHFFHFVSPSYPIHSAAISTLCSMIPKFLGPKDSSVYQHLYGFKAC